MTGGRRRSIGPAVLAVERRNHKILGAAKKKHTFVCPGRRDLLVLLFCFYAACPGCKAAPPLCQLLASPPAGPTTPPPPLTAEHLQGQVVFSDACDLWTAFPRGWRPGSAFTTTLVDKLYPIFAGNGKWSLHCLLHGNP